MNRLLRYFFRCVFGLSSAEDLYLPQISQVNEYIYRESVSVSYSKGLQLSSQEKSDRFNSFSIYHSSIFQLTALLIPLLNYPCTLLMLFSKREARPII